MQQRSQQPLLGRVLGDALVHLVAAPVRQVLHELGRAGARRARRERLLPVRVEQFHQRRVDLVDDGELLDLREHLLGRALLHDGPQPGGGLLQALRRERVDRLDDGVEGLRVGPVARVAPLRRQREQGVVAPFERALDGGRELALGLGLDESDSSASYVRSASP